KSGLTAENETHLKACMKAIDDCYGTMGEKAKGIDEFKSAFQTEHEKHVDYFTKAIDEFKSIDEFEKGAGEELSRHEKAQMDLCKAEMDEGETEEEKSVEKGQVTDEMQEDQLLQEKA